MFNKLKLLINTFNDKEKRRLFQLQVLVFIMTIFQIVSIASFAPFISMVADLSVLNGESFLSDLYHESKLSEDQFLLWFGIVVIFLVSLSSFLSIWVNWLLFRFSSRLGMNLSTRLLSLYLYRNFLFHVNNSSSFLLKQIIIEARRIGDGIITPFIQLVANFFFILMVAISLAYYKPFVTIIGGLILLIVYISIYLFTKNKIKLNGQNITNKSLLRSKIALNSFGGVREILHLNKQEFFVKRFDNASRSFADSQSLNSTFSIFPKYVVEFVTLISIVTVLIIAKQNKSSSFLDLIPVVVVFGLLLIKLIPAFQGIFGNLAKIKANLPAFDALKDDLIDISKNEDLFIIEKKTTDFNSLEIKNLCYKYPGERGFILNGVNLTINKNESIGLVGFSGAGKSTLIDILVGFLDYKVGKIILDGEVLTKSTHNEFKKKIGFVSQNVFLLDASIEENIAFGVEEDKIDYEKLNKSIQQSSLEELLKDLPNGLKTQVGERGVQLSGGQIQRIAIARSLYKECEILIFDEATSSLDGITERNILQSINNLQGKKTIIMIAHRLTTLEDCDKIYVLDKGKVDDFGNFKYLSKNNLIFKKMLKNE